VHCRPPTSLHKWLKNSQSPAPDIICLGFQELFSQLFVAGCVPSEQSLWINGLRYGSKSLTGLDNLSTLLTTVLGEIHGSGGPSYQLLWAGRRAALGMIIVVKDGITPTTIHTGSVGSGLLGVYGNKGGIGFSMEFLPKNSHKPSRFTFINTHLGAHEGEAYCKWRVEESDHILESLLLYPFPFQGESPFYTKKEKDSNPRKTLLPKDGEVIFVLGDLNFRLSTAHPEWGAETNQLPRQEVVDKLIKEESIKSLVEMDELTLLRSQKLGVLSQFSEAEITFLPTYKLSLDPIRKYSKKRLPAYCDRILYFSDHRYILQPLEYSRIEDYNHSDHDPVVGLYCLERVSDSEIKQVISANTSKILYLRVIRILTINWRLIAFIMGYVFIKNYLGLWLW